MFKYLLARYCEKCVHIKPDRCHHCSVCGVCVTKMDHHCPWVNNCVGFKNYKFFILFLGYAFIYCIFVAFTSLPYFIQFWKVPVMLAIKGHRNDISNFNFQFFFFTEWSFGHRQIPRSFSFFRIDNVFHFSRFPMGLSYLPCIAQSVNTRYVVFSTVYNEGWLITTFSEAFRAPIFRSGPDKDGFNLGKYNNFVEVFGDRKSHWFLPIFTR